MIALSCSNIVKSFDNTRALDGISIELEENRIYGLLGRNGAGKTTLLRTIGNELIQDSGSVKVFGEELFDNRKALENICLVKERVNYFKDYRLKDLFSDARIFYKNWDMEFAERLTDAFKIDINKPIIKMSKGMKSIAGIITGLASRAPVTAYDEPYLGLDAAARQRFYDILVNDFYENPRTIIFSTHLIDEMSKLFEKIIIIDEGRVIFTEDVEELREKAFYVSGKKETVDDYISGRNIIYSESMGGLKLAGVIQKGIADDKNKLAERGMDLSPIPLQKLFIHITEGNGRDLNE